MNPASVALIDHHTQEIRKQLLSEPSDYTRKILSETRAKFSLARLYSECGESGGLRDGLEREICEEAARGAGVHFDVNRPIVPWSALAPQKRDLTAGTGTAGGYLTQVDNLDAIDMLRPWSVSVRAGITIVPNLKGNTTFPKTNTNATGYWLNSESAAITTSTPVLGQLALTPRTAGALVTASRRLLKQGAQTEPFIRRDLLRTIGTTIDHVVLNGLGSAEPLGVLNTAGIGATSGTSLNWSTDVLGMQETVAEANADDAIVSFIGTPTVRKLLSGRERAPGSGFIWESGRIAGQPGYVTTDMPSGALICGAWPELILALWGPGIELQINPNEPTLFKAGIVQVRCLVSCDVGLAHSAAFNAATSVT